MASLKIVNEIGHMPWTDRHVSPASRMIASRSSPVGTAASADSTRESEGPIRNGQA